VPHETARQLAQLLDPGLLPVLDRIDAGAATPADLQAIQGWPAAHRGEVLDHVRGALPPLPQLTDALNALSFPADGWHPSTTLGPATVSVDCAAAVVHAGGVATVLGLLPPSGGGLALDAGALSAAGTLMRAGDTAAAGSLGVRLGPAQVIGFARLDVAGGPPSIVVVLGLHFLPPIQLSFGFALSAVGGIVGVNHRIDKDALHARLADGSALDALFPDDPVKGAGAVLATLDAIFRREPGQHVVGPTFTVTWLDIGFTSIVRLDVGLLLQLPDPLVVIVGRGAIELPPVLQLRLDVAGELDPGRKLFGLDAFLVDSHALTIFRVTGSATVRVGWGSPSYVVFAVGGFYPGFRPEPANIPPQQRLALALDIPCPLTFRASGYLAITSNSFQAGADIEVGIDLDIISASGFLRFDAIVEFDPFHVHADYSAGWEIDVAIFSGGTTVSGWIDGPGPWAVHAEVSISLLIDDFTWSDTFHFGPDGPPAEPPLEHAVDVLQPTLGAASHIRSADAVDPHVEVRPRKSADAKDLAVCSPLAALTWTQTALPLGLPITRAGGRRLAAPQQVDVQVDPQLAQAASPPEAYDWFAPGTFQDFTAAEALNLPPFQWLRAGTRLELAPTSGSTATGSLDYQAFYRRDRNTWLEGNLAAYWALPLRSHDAVAAHAAPPAVRDREPLVHVVQETWAVTQGGETFGVESAAHAVLAARDDGVAHALADAPLAVGAI
jgi:hypothetical protein